MTEVNNLLGVETISEKLLENIPVLHLDIEHDESIYKYEYLFKVYLYSIHGPIMFVVFKHKGNVFKSKYMSISHMELTVEQYVDFFYNKTIVKYDGRHFNKEIAVLVIKEYLKYVDETAKYFRFYNHIENLKQVLVA